MDDQMADRDESPDELAFAVRNGVSLLFSKSFIVPIQDSDAGLHRTEFARELFRTRDSEAIVQYIEVLAPDGSVTSAANVYCSAQRLVELDGARSLEGLRYLEDSPDGLTIKRSVWPPEPTELRPRGQRKRPPGPGVDGPRSR